MSYKLIDEPIKCRIVGNLINVVGPKEETYIPIAKVSRFTLLKFHQTNEVLYNKLVTDHPDTVYGIRFNVYAVVDKDNFAIRQFCYEVQSASDWEAAYREIVNDWFDPFMKDIDAVYNHGGV